MADILVQTVKYLFFGGANSDFFNTTNILTHEFKEGFRPFQSKRLILDPLKSPARFFWTCRNRKNFIELRNQEFPIFFTDEAS